MVDTITYKDSGVDIDAGNELVNRLKKKFPDIGGFGGLYPFSDGFLVAGTDGVGTKLKIAFSMDKHDTIGIDLVAMCVNDVLASGAKPLFFLDYFATSDLHVDKAESVLSGIGEGCREARCLLLGGETAEMPGFYHHGEYDLSGFCVGFVHKEDLIDADSIEVGDCIVGIPSSGFHSNGYSLIRKVLDENNINLHDLFPGSNSSIGELLLKPTRIYIQEVLAIKEEFNLKGAAHITGGGLTENVPRILPECVGALIDKKLWEVPTIFSWIQTLGSIEDKEMFRTFNMGLGMTLILSKQDAKTLCSRDNDYMIIGETVEGKGVKWR
ncbi:MAG: phosphoribosylformylglycinamidine cyclo-ligase [Chlamydiota bacterium]|nr:phosphoribosylformylglycinamidine cyclo-ligase [Chlamydiota bacterium]